MIGSHKTSAIARPGTRRARSTGAPRRGQRHEPARPERRDVTRIGDLTRPIGAERQLITRRSARWAFALGATAVLVALVAALFVFPVQAWRRQEDTIAVRQRELAVLDDANDSLAVEIGHLQTPEGAKEAAREELGVVGAGEERVSVLPDAGMTITLPSGWPYDAVRQIVAMRAQALSAAAAPAATAPSAVSVAP